MRKRPCLLFACIFLTGIVSRRYDWLILRFVPVIFLVLEIYFGVSCYVKNNANPSHVFKTMIRVAGRSLILLSAFFLGVSNMKSQEHFRNTYMSKIEDNSEAVVYGEILTIEETEYGSRLILTDSYISLNETVVPCNKVMVYVSSDQYHIGQIYQIKGQLNLFKQARNEGNFDASLFYQSQKIDFAISASECVLLEYKQNYVRDCILNLKEHLSNVYKNSLKEEVAGFYVGMMLGDKSLLSEETKDLFAIGGISHILAISGLHISMIGRGLYTQLRKRRISFFVAGLWASVVLLCYCFMVGSGMSAVRAAGMMLLFFLSQYWGRSYDMLNALGAMIIYLLWDNPFLIEYSGFQFSVTALMGVGVVGKILSETNERPVGETEDRKSKWNFAVDYIHQNRKNWISNLWMSIGITLATLPIVAVCYFEIPLYSPLVNSLVLPMLTPIFALAVFGGLIGCLLPVTAKFLLMPCGWLYEFYEFVCEFVARLPFGSVITGKPKLQVVVLYYVVLFVGIVIINNVKCFVEGETKDNDCISKADSNSRTTEELRLCEILHFSVILCRTILVSICIFLMTYQKPLQSEIIFLDVGQGDGIFIASSDGTTCFIDGGSSDVKKVGEYRILPFLKAHGIKKIDYWFVTHADTDHISGLIEVLETGYEITNLVVSDKMPEDEKKEKLLDLAKEQAISVIQMKAGERIETYSANEKSLFLSEGIRIQCLYPFEEGKDKNEQSIVLLVEFLDDAGESRYKALFSGDISAMGEAELIRKGDLMDVDLFKAAHHGSKYSNSKEFLDVLQPEVCVISCGKDNSYGHPHTEAVERIENIGAEVFYTMESGQMTFEIGESIRIKSWLKENPP